MPIDLEAELGRLGAAWNESIDHVGLSELLGRPTVREVEVDLDLELPAMDDLTAVGDRDPRRRWRWLAAAAVVSLIVAATAAALTWGGHDDRQPAAPPETSVPVDTSPRTVVVRPNDGGDGRDGLDIVAVEPGGAERVLGRVVPPFAGFRLLPDTGQVSAAGWFAIEVATNGVGREIAEPPPPEAYVVFVDLRDPTAEPWSIAGSFAADGRWNLAGDQYAISTDDGSAILVDMATRQDRVTRPGPPDGERVWSDGERSISIYRTNLGSNSRRFAFMNPWNSDADMVAPAFRGLGPRLVSDDGRVICRFPLACTYGPPTVRIEVWTAADPAPANGKMEATRWYDDDLRPASLVGASFSAVDGSVWALLTTENGGRAGLMIARTTAPGSTEVVVAFVGYDEGAESKPPEIAGISTDDSLIVTRAGAQTLVIPTDGNTAYALPSGSTFVGFLAAAVLASLPAVA